DAIMIEAPLDRLDGAVNAAERAMAEASAVILDNYVLRSDVKRICYPNHYSDVRGQRMWDTVNGIIRELQPSSAHDVAQAHH
ncbi:MAG: DNA polymerase I, partial [Candidatus Latescibacterota bacterium]